MSSTLVVLALFVGAIAMIPYAIKWLKQRAALGGSGVLDASRIISAVAVGAHQRVVTLEVGPAHARIWLTLGVTQTTISCLHKSTVVAAGESVDAGSPEKKLVDKWMDKQEGPSKSDGIS
jgi:flagellar protein FliO/FliZ